MLLVQWIFLPLHTKYFTMYIMTVILVYNLSIHKTLKQVDCLLTGMKRAVASVPEKHVRYRLGILLMLMTKTTKWCSQHRLPLILNPLVNLTFYVLGEEGEVKNSHQTTRPRVMFGSSFELLLISSTVNSNASRGWIPGIAVVLITAL